MKVCSMIGLVVGIILIALSFYSGLEFDWGILGVVSGVGIILNSIALLQISNKK